MRKNLLTALLALAASGNALAQTDNGYTVLPSPADDEAITYTISPNGRYVGGYTLINNQAYMYDTQTKEYKLFGEASESNFNDMRSISNEGKGTCILDTGSDWFGTVYSFKGDAAVEYGSGTLPKGISVDGGIVVGAKMNDDGQSWSACYWDGTTQVLLPEPTSKWSGWQSTDPDDPETVFGSSADFISEDSTIIAGWLIDNMATYPAVVWRQNRDGKTYSVDFISRKYFDSLGDGTSGEYAMFNTSGMSPNGKWLALTLGKIGEDGWAVNYGFGRYNLDTDELETYMFGDDVQEAFAAAIANDGTMVGATGGRDAEQGVIWKAGEDAAVALAEKFPGVPQFAEFDLIGGHKPCAISSDGRYIVGYGYYDRSASATDSDSDAVLAGYESYIFDTQAKGALSAVESAPVANKKSNKVIAHFDLSGKRVSGNVNGINIYKMASGRAVKALAK